MALTYVAATAWNTAGTNSGTGYYKDFTFTGVAVGDFLAVGSLAESANYAAGVRSATTQSGTVSGGAWTLIQPAAVAATDADALGAYAVASSSGTIVVRIQIRPSSAGHMGVSGVRIPAAEWNAAGAIIPGTTFNDADGQISLTLTTSTYTVLSWVADWNAGTASTGMIPSTGTNRETLFDTAGDARYTIFVRTWTAQATGTRNYGPGATTTNANLSGLDATGFVIAIPEASGGTNYTASPAEAVGITDVATVVKDVARGPADVVGITDVAAVVQDVARAPADTVGGIDAVTLDVGRFPADSVGGTDAASPVLDAVRAPGDTVGGTDVAASVLDAVRAASDVAGILDVAATVADDVRGPADTAGATDAVTVEQGFARADADDVDATDAVTVEQFLERTVSDAIGILDAADSETSSAGGQNPSDDAGITDGVSTVMTLERTAVELAGITDSVTIELIRLYEIEINDGLAIDDDATAQSSGSVDYVIVINDGVGITDVRAITHSGDAPVTVRTLTPIPRTRTMSPVSRSRGLTPLALEE